MITLVLYPDGRRVLQTIKNEEGLLHALNTTDPNDVDGVELREGWALYVNFAVQGSAGTSAINESATNFARNFGLQEREPLRGTVVVVNERWFDVSSSRG